MIRVNKIGHIVPNVLLIDGVAKKNLHIVNYLAAPAGYHLNSKKARSKFVFDDKIYGHDDVKTLLKTIQSDKCCFCEAKVSHIAYGDIEHFRPKAAYKQAKNTKLVYPGYFWFAYDWSNLFFSCQICNGRGKKNYFPLINNANRANSTIRNIANEEPLFIDPSGPIDPETQIFFIGEFPFSRTRKGKVTIDYLGLDRNELNEDRLDALEKLRSIEEIVNLTADSVNSVRAKTKFFNCLRTCVQPTSEYSSMFKSNFHHYLGLL